MKATLLDEEELLTGDVGEGEDRDVLVRGVGSNLKLRGRDHMNI